MPYVYSNPYADAANMVSGGLNTLGETMLRSALLRQQQQEQARQYGLQLAQFQQGQEAQRDRLRLADEEMSLRRTEQKDSSAYRDAMLNLRAQEAGDQMAGTALNRRMMQQRLDDAMKYRSAQQQFGAGMSRLLQPGGEDYITAPVDLNRLAFEAAQTPQEGFNNLIMSRMAQSGVFDDQSAMRERFTGHRPLSVQDDFDTLAALYGRKYTANQGMRPENDPNYDNLEMLVNMEIARRLGTNSVPVLRPQGGTNSSNIKSIRQVK